MENESIHIVKLSNARAVLAAKRQQALDVRRAIVYALICVAIAAAISYICNAAFPIGNADIKSKLIPACSFTLLGILFTGFLYNQLRFFSKANYTGGVVYSLAVFACIFSVTCLIGIIKRNTSIITCLYYSCLFLLPFVIYQTWLFYDSLLPGSLDKLWYLPEQTSQAPKATVFLNSVHLKIKMAPAYGATEKVYDTTVPGRISLGTMFTNFVHEENDTDERKFEDISNQSFGWNFFVPSFMGTRKLDADLSLDQNNIKSDTLIIARRVPI